MTDQETPKKKEVKDSLYDYFPSFVPKVWQDRIVGATLLGPFLVPLAVILICLASSR